MNCPARPAKLGHVNLLIVTQHGSNISSNPASIADMHPDVALMGSGGKKGGDEEPIKTIKASPGLMGFWQTHENFAHPEWGGDKNMIANLNPPAERGGGPGQVAVQRAAGPGLCHPCRGHQGRRDHRDQRPQRVQQDLSDAVRGLFAAVAVLLLAAPAVAETPLRIVSIDVEGGAATLFVTPEGKSLLIDSGWPAGFGEMPSPDGTAEAADRIVAAAKKLGVSKLDYVLVTHYHDDHSGGVAALASKISIGAFIDHGANGDGLAPNTPPERVINTPAGQYPRYLAAAHGP